MMVYDEEILLLRDGSKYILRAYPNEEVVSEPTIWSETHVRSTGGGGYVHPTQGGHVSAPQVYSTVTERQSYFVKLPTGKESEIRDSVPARKGHIIREIYGYPHPLTTEKWDLLATKNVTTSDYRREKLGPKHLANYISLSGCMPISSSLKNNFIFKSTGLIILLAIGTLFIPFVGWIISLIIIYLLIKARSERKKRITQLNNDIVSFIKKIGPSPD